MQGVADLVANVGGEHDIVTLQAALLYVLSHKPSTRKKKRKKRRKKEKEGKRE